MTGSVLTFLGGLFALLAVLIPMAANAYRKAKAEGTLRVLILRIFASMNILFWSVGCVIVLFKWNPILGLSCFFASLICTAIVFGSNPRLPMRGEVLGLLIMVFGCLIFMALELVRVGLTIEALK